MLFRRRGRSLHERLAEEGGLELDPTREGPVDAGPNWGEVGIHGVHRPRRWDAVVAVAADGPPGNEVAFAALPDGTLVVEDDLPDGSLAPLADAVEAVVQPPYRAEGVRRAEGWAVAANRIEVASLPGLEGDVADLAVSDGVSTLHLDGQRAFGSASGLEALARARGLDAYAIRAERLDGDLFEVRISAL